MTLPRRSKHSPPLPLVLDLTCVFGPTQRQSLPTFRWVEVTTLDTGAQPVLNFTQVAGDRIVLELLNGDSDMPPAVFADALVDFTAASTRWLNRASNPNEHIYDTLPNGDLVWVDEDGSLFSLANGQLETPEPLREVWATAAGTIFAVTVRVFDAVSGEIITSLDYTGQYTAINAASVDGSALYLSVTAGYRRTEATPCTFEHHALRAEIP